MSQQPQLSETSIYINYRCNLKCKLCYMYGVSEENHRYRFLEKEKEMSFDIFRKAIDGILAVNPACAFFIMGGEPMLHKKVVEMVEYIRQNGSGYIDLNTNGSLLKKKGEEILKAGLSNLIISLDGYNAEICDAVRGKGVFKKAIEGIKFLEKVIKRDNLPVEISINSTITNMNYRYLVELGNLCNQIRIDNLYLNFPMFVAPEDGILSQKRYHELFNENMESWKGFLLEEIIENIDSEILINQLKQIQSMKKNFYLNIVPYQYSYEALKTYFNKEWKAHYNKLKCPKLYFRTTILPDGSVTPCTVFLDMVFGNIKKENFRNIWKGKKYMHFRKELDKQLLPICKRCCDLLDESNGETYNLGLPRNS